MGVPNDQTELVRTLVGVLVLMVFLFGLDPVFIWVALNALGIPVGLATIYALLVALLSVFLTLCIVAYLAYDRPTQPNSPTRKIVRIT